MNVAVFIFVVILNFAAGTGLARPIVLLRSFHSLSRILGIDPDKAPAKTLKAFRITCGVVFVLSLIVLGGMVGGEIHF